MTHIYALIDPRDNQVRYIGKSDAVCRRFKEHQSDIKSASNNKKIAWLKKLSKLGLQPRVVIIETISKLVWAETEIEWIRYFRSIGARLTNSTDGGEGIEGYKLTEAQKEKVSKMFKGKRFTEEHKRKIGESNTGKKRTDAMKEKLSTLYKGKAGRPHTEETKKKMSESNKMRSDPNLRQLIASFHIGAKRTEESRKKMSEARKGKKFGPRSEETKRRISEGRKKTEALKKCSPFHLC